MDNSLPKLPGLDFSNRLRQHHSVSHCFDFRNGYRQPRRPPCGIGGQPLTEDSIAYASTTAGDTGAAMYDPCLTYGRVRNAPVEPFRPQFVRYDRIVLTFRGFFKQAVPESRAEHYRIRHVNVMYFMEDDTLTVYEPPVRDCGFPQGRLVRRGRALRTNTEYYTWKHLNIGCDLELNGTVYHLCDCDAFTREFLTAQGIELGDSEALPLDPYTSDKLISSVRPQHQTPSDDDKLRRYLEFQGKVLTFDALLQDERADDEPGDAMTYKVFYYLEDDTIAVKELKENQQGRDRFPMLLKRMRLARNWRQRPLDFPSCTLETSDREVTEYYQPKHMRVGDTVFVFGRRLLLLDCDAFTRRYFADVLHQPQGDRHEIVHRPAVRRVRELPEYLGLGTPEDSLQSCLALQPKAPAHDLVTAMLNAGKFLSFGARLDSAHPEHTCRRFVVMLSLADGKMKINEPVVRNSGIRGGPFLRARLVPRPDCDPKRPTYYGPSDMRIGATLLVNAHRFRLDSADLFSYRYMREHAEMFAPEAIAEVAAYCLQSGNLKADVREAMERECEEYRRVGAEEATAAATAGDGFTGMEQCLKDVHVYEGAQKEEGGAGSDKYQYDVDVSNNAERKPEELRQQNAYYVSGRCSNDPEPYPGTESKSVRFEEDTKFR